MDGFLDCSPESCSSSATSSHVENRENPSHSGLLNLMRYSPNEHSLSFRLFVSRRRDTDGSISHRTFLSLASGSQMSTAGYEEEKEASAKNVRVNQGLVCSPVDIRVPDKQLTGGAHIREKGAKKQQQISIVGEESLGKKEVKEEAGKKRERNATFNQMYE